MIKKIKLNRLNFNNGKNYCEALSNDNEKDKDVPGHDLEKEMLREI